MNEEVKSDSTDHVNVWEHFKKCDDHSEKKAKCLHCKQTYSYISTIANLKRHLQRHGLQVDSKTKKFKKMKLSKGELRLSRRLLWKNFINKNDYAKTTECKYCGKLLSYKSTTGNIKRHLYNSHRKTYNLYLYEFQVKMLAMTDEDRNYDHHEESDDDGESDDEVISQENIELKDEEPASDEEEKEAAVTSLNVDDDIAGYFECEGGRSCCAVCREPVQQLAGAMRAHLRGHHPKLLPENDQNEASDDQQGEDEELYTEVVYLEEQQQSADEATSPRSRRKRKATDVESEPVETSKKHIDEVWEHFQKASGEYKVAYCNHCPKKLSYKTTISNLKQHLRLKHPQDYKDYLRSSGARESPGLQNVRPSWRASSPDSDVNVSLNVLKDTKRRRPASPPQPRKNPDEEEIESFGAYITCLLKSLPKDICSAVQRDIITLIVNAKLTKPDKIVIENSHNQQRNYIVIANEKELDPEEVKGAEETKVQYSIRVANAGDEKDNTVETKAED